MAAARIAGVLLAAGRGARFGGNKLEAMLAGVMIGEHAARALAGCGCEWNAAICGADVGALGSALDRLGLVRIINDAPEAGLSLSLCLATQYAIDSDADGILVCLADMPFVGTAHLNRLIRAFDAYDRRQCIASRSDTVRMPPAIFPRSVFPALTFFSGDHGAQTLLQDAITVSAAPGLLADIDTRSDLERVPLGRSPEHG